MVAVRRPVSGRACLRRANRDDRIKESPELADHGLEPAVVRFREVALVGGGLHLLNRERGHEEPASAEGLTVYGEHLPAVVLDRAMEFGDLSRRRRRQQFHSPSPVETPAVFRRRTVPGSFAFRGLLSAIGSTYSRGAGRKRKARGTTVLAIVSCFL